ncbi:hypothetical protein ABMA28_010266 [Loxostege sticticalis]|uniref:Integrase catalytic domain-containing protein n=1 Tax=Loxostege sticticalis TaxID=481309 RepID=A0ABD0SAX9_LOXSC
MPVTRSTSGKSKTSAPAASSSAQTASTEGTQTGTESSSAATETESSNTAPTVRMEETTTRTERPPQPAATVAWQPEPRATAAPPPVVAQLLEKKKAAARPASKASTSASRRAARLMKAREELLRLKVELAAAKIAAIEAETDSEEEDIDTVVEDKDAEDRVDTWLNNSIQPLAIANEPHNQPAPPPPTTQATTAAPAGDMSTAIEGAATANKIDLTDLAAAIAQAARTGHHSTSRILNELPIFTGNHQEWLAYKAAYHESQSGFTDLENLARLRKSLRGRAREAVESLLIYTANPRDIMKTLENRFGRTDAIAVAELDKLRSLPRLTDAPRDICVFSSRINNVVATLGAIGKQQYLYNPELTKTTIEKLSPTVRYRWYDYAATQDESDPDIVKMARFLNREAELCGPYAQPEGLSRSQKTYNVESGQSERREEDDRNVQRCPACNKEGHNTTSCPEFKTAGVSTRWDICKKNRLCFRCLRLRKKTHHCRSGPCEKDGCKFWHHPMLHHEAVEKKSSEVVSSTWTGKSKHAFLKIVPIKVIGPRKVIPTYALLDDGSTVTLIDEELAQRAGLRGRREPLHIEAIGDTKVDTSTSRRLSLLICGSGARHRIEARTMRNLRLSPQSINDGDLKDCRHLEDLPVTTRYKEARPQVLIGQDNWPLLLAEDKRIGSRHQPVASKTPLGWVLHGACTRTLGQRVNFLNEADDTNRINQQLQHFFSLEALAVQPKRPANDPEEKAMKILEKKTSRMEDGRFQTGLLWKSEDIQLPDNRQYALRRLEATEKKIEKDPELKTKVVEQMAELVKKGYAEPAPAEKTPHRTWYLPCFPVLNPMKPGKVRMVHDAAATTKGVSLNDALLTGPDLLQSLPGVLMRMRQHRVAVSADIAEMFLQVKIIPEDRDAIRYLWRDGDRSSEVKEFRMTSLIFGATSSPATAIYVKNKNAEDFKTEHPTAVAAINKNHYMDDYIQSFEDEETAIETSRQVRDIHRRAHFELRKWASNTNQVLLALEEKEETTELSIGPKTEKILGMVWETSSDSLRYNLDLSRLPDDILQIQRPTKRQALQIVMSLFDPLGLVSPVTIKAKQILQEIWRRSTKWDDLLDEDLAEQWVKWTQHLEALREVKIPRCYPGYSNGNRRELHIFVDASEAAYAAAVYWRVEDPEGRAHTSLALAKAKVAPLKTTSIPRLELQAALLGSRLAASVIEEHDEKPASRTFWTDSKTVLTWLRTGARSYKPFVAHRIAEIEENTKIEEWRWVPTKMNVADDGTREVPQEFNERHRWFNGPSFLLEDPSTWPAEAATSPPITGEEKTLTVNKKKPPALEVVPDPKRFSRWEKLIRATARVLQFAAACRKPATVTYSRTKANPLKDPTWKKQENHRKRAGIEKKTVNTQDKFKKIPAALLIEAEKLVIKASQQESFGEEIQNLSKGLRVRTDSKLYRLSTEIEDGVVVVKTRIGAARDIPQEMKRPPILDGKQHVARLYIEHIHRVGHHQGVAATINQCRQRFHILGLRTTARGIIHQCVPCRRRRLAPPEPPTGDLPPGRLAHHQRPFTHTGVDYFGPLLTTQGRATKKTYVALFTCLTTRAVHLEMAATLTTDSAVMALRRFIARRGCPHTIWSDNGTNLHGAEKELRLAADAATEEEAAKRRITWRFIPPGAPFMGGAWERLVRTVKTALAAVLDKPTSEEVLATLLAEVEMTVNSRPLTHVSLDPEEPEALTPNHFILLGPAHEPPMGETSPQDLQGRHTWRTSQRLADLFWARWVREYLPELHHRREPHGRGPPLCMGDIVIVADNTLPRNTWPLGRVTATYPGPDGVIRAADVRTKNGILRRPTKKLVILVPAHSATVVPPVQRDASDSEATSRRTAGECSGRPKYNSESVE